MTQLAVKLTQIATHYSPEIQQELHQLIHDPDHCIRVCSFFRFRAGPILNDRRPRVTGTQWMLHAAESEHTTYQAESNQRR